GVERNTIDAGGNDRGARDTAKVGPDHARPVSARAVRPENAPPPRRAPCVGAPDEMGVPRSEPCRRALGERGERPTRGVVRPDDPGAGRAERPARHILAAHQWAKEMGLHFEAAAVGALDGGNRARAFQFSYEERVVA